MLLLSSTVAHTSGSCATAPVPSGNDAPRWTRAGLQRTGKSETPVLSLDRVAYLRAVHASGLSVRTRDHAAQRGLLRRPLVPRLHALPWGPRVGLGALGPAARDDLLCRGAAERCERYPTVHHR